MSNTAKTILSILAIGLIGFIAGYVTHRAIVKKNIKDIARTRIAPGLEQRMIKMLDLTEEQRTKVNPIIEKYTTQLITLSEESRKKREPILKGMFTEVKKHLTEEQIKKFEGMKKRMENGKKYHKRHPRDRFGDKKPKRDHEREGRVKDKNKPAESQRDTI